MNHIKNLTLATLCAAAFTSSAYADLPDGWYGGVTGGRVFNKIKPSGDDITIAKEANVTNMAGETMVLTFKDGYQAAILAGFKQGDWRYEGELSFSKSKYKSLLDLNELGGGVPDELISDNWKVSGNIKTTTLMAKALYDFNVNPTVKPYLGAGAGLMHVKNFISAENFGTPSKKLTQTKLAVQGIAGVRIPINDRFSATADYRYTTTVGRVRALDTRYGNHSVNLGLVFSI